MTGPASELGGTGVIDELIRQRAYEISQSSDAGSADENWQRAAREIEAELQSESEDRPQPRHH